MAITLSCFLSASALAGDVPSGGIFAPPPNETSPTTSAPAPGEVPSVGLTQQMSGAVLGLVQLVLGIV
jgi:hypothetical protein